MKKFIICLLGLTVLTVGVEAKSYSRSSSRSYSKSSRSYKSSTRTKSSITSIKPKTTSTHKASISSSYSSKPTSKNNIKSNTVKSDVYSAPSSSTSKLRDLAKPITSQTSSRYVDTYTSPRVEYVSSGGGLGLLDYYMINQIVKSNNNNTAKYNQQTSTTPSMHAEKLDKLSNDELQKILSAINASIHIVDGSERDVLEKLRLRIIEEQRRRANDVVAPKVENVSVKKI